MMGRGWKSMTASEYRDEISEKEPLNADRWYPGGPRGNVCLGIRVNGPQVPQSSKNKLREQYGQLNLPFRCHSCGKSLDSGTWIGDHQPTTDCVQHPLMLQRLQYSPAFVQRKLKVVHTANKEFETTTPVANSLAGMFQGQTPVNWPSQYQYIYPQCRDCSNHQG